MRFDCLLQNEEITVTLQIARGNEKAARDLRSILDSQISLC